VPNSGRSTLRWLVPGRVAGFGWLPSHGHARLHARRPLLHALAGHSTHGRQRHFAAAIGVTCRFQWFVEFIEVPAGSFCTGQDGKCEVAQAFSPCLEFTFSSMAKMAMPRGAGFQPYPYGILIGAKAN
jgi:hypothetical protein